MAYDFTADDVFEMAEQMERNGAKYYRETSDSVEDADLKKFLMRLSHMEVAHEKLFKDLRADLSRKEREERVFDPNAESTKYLQALVGDRVTFVHEEHGAGSMEDILKSAVQSEKDTIIFYLGIKEAVSEDLGKSRIDRLIKEEMGHVRMLTQKLNELT